MSSARPWLLPLVPLYRLGLALRERRLASGREPVRRLQRPVVSIGNLSAGGSGKTPLTIALAEALTRRGWRVVVLSRGYGRQGNAPRRVDPAGSAADFGDEPLLIARACNVPVYVAAQRYEAGKLAEAESAPHGVAVHLLDDGFQHRQLHRDVNILLLSLGDWHDHLLPAGNLREGLRAAQRADVIAIPHDQPELEAALRVWGWSGQVWRLRRRMAVPRVQGPVVAFCGIARPKQFFAGLTQAGIELAQSIAFPDHHRYTPRDLDRLRQARQRTGASELLTTEKDAVRLGNAAADLPIRAVPLRTEIEDEDAALNWLAARLAAAETPTAQS